MRVLGLAFAVLLAGTASIVAHANDLPSNMAPVNAGPAPDIVLAWDGGGSGETKCLRSRANLGSAARFSLVVDRAL
jgi:hypothetical protein